MPRGRRVSAADQRRARARGVKLGGFRKAKVFDRQRVIDLRQAGKTYDEIMAATAVARGTILRVLTKAGS